MSLSNEISDLEKLVTTQIESVNLSLRAMSAVFAKLEAVSTLPNDLRTAQHPKMLEIIKGGLCKRLEALIDELEKGRAKFVTQNAARFGKLLSTNAADLSDRIEQVYLAFDSVYNFKLPAYLTLDTDNVQHVLTELQLSSISSP